MKNNNKFIKDCVLFGGDDIEKILGLLFWLAILHFIIKILQF
jgi:hypothetical protein